MKEFYHNEKHNNRPQVGGGIIGQPGNGIVSGWIDPEETKPDIPEFVDPDKLDRLPPQADQSALRSTAHSLLMADANGELFCCNQLCGEVPDLLVVIESKEFSELCDSHARCIQINLEYKPRKPLVLEPTRTLQYNLWPVDRSIPQKLLPEEVERIHYSGFFPLPEPGERLTIKAAWQKGHFDINQVSVMKFWIFNVNCGTMSIGINNWRTIATVTVDELFHITVNGLRGELPGGKRNKNAN